MCRTGTCAIGTLNLQLIFRLRANNKHYQFRYLHIGGFAPLTVFNDIASCSVPCVADCQSCEVYKTFPDTIVYAWVAAQTELAAITSRVGSLSPVSLAEKCTVIAPASEAGALMAAGTDPV